MTRERDARGTPRLSRARDVAARWAARAARFFGACAGADALVAAIAPGRRAEDDETVAMGEDGVSVREAALGESDVAGRANYIASLNAKRIHYRPPQEEALGRGKRSEVGGERRRGDQFR